MSGWSDPAWLYVGPVCQGLLWTLALGWVALCLGAGIALLWVGGEHHPVARPVVRTLGAVIRAVPELLLIYLVFFGATALLTRWSHQYTELHPFWAGALALGVLFGAYAAEVLRACLDAVPVGQRQVGVALGLSPRHIFWHITWPQGLRLAQPGLVNLALITLKDTALVGLIGVPEITHQAHLASIQTQKPLVFYALAGCIYLAITSCVQHIDHRIRHVSDH